MKNLQIIPKDGFRLYGALIKKEVELSKKNRGTFYRAGKKQRDKAKWRHKSEGYPGWIDIQRAGTEVVIVKIQTKGDKAVRDEWKILTAFIGFVDRNFSDQVQAINIQNH